MADEFADDIIEELIRRLSEGEGLATICRDKRMPGRTTVQRWAKLDDELAQRILDAREVGFHALAEKMLADVEKAKDPIKARVVFDARRWYLGKLSNAFADKPIAIGAVLNVGADDAWAAVTGALEVAAAGIESRRHRTITVAPASPAGPTDADGGLADLASPSRPGLGQDADRG